VDLARPLALALAATARRTQLLGGGEELLVPVPLHVRRRLERGYDQAARLAEELERATGLVLARGLRRVRDTPVQGAVGSSSRAANVRGAFAPARRRAGWARGRRVWLVDDVVTSGATVAECARVLRRLGAQRVGVLALARAVPRQARGGAPLRYPGPP
jgi:ComF family protein